MVILFAALLSSLPYGEGREGPGSNPGNVVKGERTRLHEHVMLVQFLNYADHCLIVGESIVVTYFVSEC